VLSWFNQAYYFEKKQTWENTFWMGVPLYKCPTDLWVYQEIVVETRPSVIVETGTANGGERALSRNNRGPDRRGARRDG
jgi:cephalosporin hydroxylase